MSVDVSAELAGTIADAEVFGSSDNIRHGVYWFIIHKIHADVVEINKGKHKFVFWEMEPYKSEPNPQVEGDRVDYVSPTQKGVGPLKDDGTRPNAVGSRCALKIDFDGAGARSAPGNAQAPILALFNKEKGQMSKQELAETWIDISRKQPVRAGEPIGFNNETKEVIKADKDKQAQPARGMIIGCRTTVKKKKDGNENGEYITKMNWFCVAPIGTGENSWDKIKERRAKIEAGGVDDDDDDDDKSSTAGAPSGPQMPVGAGAMPPPGMQVPATPPQAAPQAPAAPPAPQAAPPLPPTAPAAVAPPPAPWVPPAGWTAYDNPQYFGNTPESRWYHNAGVVKNEAQLRAGL